MDTAFLPADHYDAGSNRVVAVLEELRSGLLNKRKQDIVMREQSATLYPVAYWGGRLDAINAFIDDIALFIQRETRS